MEWQTFAIEASAISGLLWFMRSQSRRQDELLSWFQGKLNGSLDALKNATHENTTASREVKDALHDLKDELRSR